MLYVIANWTQLPLNELIYGDASWHELKANALLNVPCFWTSWHSIDTSMAEAVHEPLPDDDEARP